MGKRDELIHVPKRIWHRHIQQALEAYTGIESEQSKQTTTGCNKRRNWERVSLNPWDVTCIKCREFAHATYHNRSLIAAGAAKNDFLPEAIKQELKEESESAALVAKAFT